MFGGPPIALPGGIDVTLLSPRPNAATVASWSLPAYAVSMRSPSIMMATGDDTLVIIRSRIAQPLNIQTGDTIEAVLNQTGDTIQLPKVTVRDTIASDILIHDFFSLGLIDGMKRNQNGELVHLVASDRDLCIRNQYLWAGLRIVPPRRGSARLLFDGASRNNPRGPSGCGFCIERDDNNSKHKVLIKGWCYFGMNRSNNEMEYEGLIEGFIWASKLNLAKLTIEGDSELVINQLNGTYLVHNDRLKVLHTKMTDLFEKYDGQTTMMHIDRQQNKIADQLANLAIESKKNNITLDWSNVNALMSGSDSNNHTDNTAGFRGNSGRTGNGTTRSTAAVVRNIDDVQRLIDAAKPGEIVAIPKGTFKIGPSGNTVLDVTKPLQLVGSRMGSTTLEGDLRVRDPSDVDPRLAQLDYSSHCVKVSDLQVSGCVQIGQTKYKTITCEAVEVKCPPTRNVNAFEVHCRGNILIDSCKIYGGSDGVYLSGYESAIIRNSTIQYARNRGIFANEWFTIKDSVICDCGSYGIKGRGGWDARGDGNHIQPGPWSEY